MQVHRPSRGPEKNPGQNEVGNDVVFVLGAGVDEYSTSPY